MRKSNLENNKLIYKLYFEDNLNLTEIHKEVNLSISQISRILSKSDLYQQEKVNRKEENRRKHNEQTKEFMSKKRNAEKMEKEKAVLDIMHNQASIELSYNHSISNANLRKSCSSAYTYNVKKKRFELKNDVAYFSDMPKII